jgi:DNA/RNA endonuclease G (NUC1)
VGAIVGGERRTRGDGGDNAVVVSGTARPLAATAATAICDMLPSPPVRIFVPNDDLAIAYDSRTKNPLYVVERLVVVRDDAVDRASSSSSSSSRQLRSGMRFREEKSLCPNHRSRNSDYRGSGYDRGHLAPAADFAVAARDDDDDDDNDNDNDDGGGGGDVSGRGRRRRGRMDDTFALTNVSPQVPRFNRTTWLRLEEFVRREARRGLQAEEGGGGKSESEANEANEGGRRSRGETWVVTGPLWLPRHYPPSAKNDDGAGGGGGGAFRYSYEGIGRPPSLVAVPTHFYKVVVVIDDPPPGEPSSEGGAGGGDAHAPTGGGGGRGMPTRRRRGLRRR